MTVGEYELPGGSGLKNQLFRLTLPVFRGAGVGLSTGHAFGESRSSSWVLPSPKALGDAKQI